MKQDRLVPILFALAGLYDGILGVAFLLAPGPLFDLIGLTPPNHFGYIRFPAALLVVFAIMFFAVATDPGANRNLVPYGILLKVSYCGVVFGYWFTQGLPDIWKPFALADIVFVALFFWAWRRIGATGSRSAA